MITVMISRAQLIKAKAEKIPFLSVLFFALFFAPFLNLDLSLIIYNINLCIFSF